MRLQEAISSPYSGLYNDLDPNYVLDNEEFVTENPLAICLFNLIELSDIKYINSVIQYNKTFGDHLSMKLAQLQLRASRELCNGYELLHQEIEERKKFLIKKSNYYVRFFYYLTPNTAS